MNAEAVAVRLISTLHKKRHMPESYSIVWINVKKHHIHLVTSVSPDTIHLTLCLLLKNTMELSYSSVKLFDTGTGRTYKGNSI